MEIVKFPDKRLRQKCRVLTPEELVSAILPETGKPLQELVKEMVETMFVANGAGLAAPQVGVPVRVFVMRVGEDKAIAIANPELKFGGEILKLEEGCLSLPGSRVRTERYSIVSLKSPSFPKEVRFKEFLAACVQHECDHLDGVLIIDNPRHKIIT